MPTYIFDDVFGDQRPGSNSPPVIYTPSPRQGSQWDPVGGTCSECTLSTNEKLPKPLDPTMAQNGTWHTVTVSPGEPLTSLSITFTGTAFTVFCILPPLFNAGYVSYSNMSFILDGQSFWAFQRTAVQDQWVYHSPVFNKSGLDNTEHTFVLSPQGQDGLQSSYLVFDYISYEYDDAAVLSQATPSIQPSVPATRLTSTSLTPLVFNSNENPSTSSDPSVPEGSGASTVPALPEQGTSVASISSDFEHQTSKTSGLSITASSSIGSTSHAATATYPSHGFRSTKSELIAGIVGGIATCLIAIFLLRYTLKRRATRQAKYSTATSITSHISRIDKLYMSEMCTIASNRGEEILPCNNGHLERYSVTKYTVPLTAHTLNKTANYYPKQRDI
ncbi:hypothetical protein PHLGIDRAFT_455356 [Phlebiopsis gigantea 11061_1 CR5-6]|uniref:Uncharacterized protein n=1 Tax=Phlebiopsis gigantea (strain 11061_1 CR5-6) TaxID=745531 RepID=A0A0C3P174_PHLG1|nr:hypothetical protein PHLGIDRAFT_455356 [Phlebiopsis gigantea 11061_1 CR5-6]